MRLNTKNYLKWKFKAISEVTKCMSIREKIQLFIYNYIRDENIVATAA